MEDALPICECSDESCDGTVPIRWDQYFANHGKYRDCYVVLPGHFKAGIRILETGANYQVIAHDKKAS